MKWMFKLFNQACLHTVNAFENLLECLGIGRSEYEARKFKEVEERIMSKCYQNVMSNWLSGGTMKPLTHKELISDSLTHELKVYMEVYSTEYVTNKFMLFYYGSDTFKTVSLHCRPSTTDAPPLFPLHVRRAHQVFFSQNLQGWSLKLLNNIINPGIICFWFWLYLVALLKDVDFQLPAQLNTFQLWRGLSVHVTANLC